MIACPAAHAYHKQCACLPTRRLDWKQEAHVQRKRDRFARRREGFSIDHPRRNTEGYTDQQGGRINTGSPRDALTYFYCLKAQDTIQRTL
ncbi:hypothetical protein HWV62_25086 [Athelia sp. TMB]|nr:hypothetical protein HWV62_25086 [Athelia sp. TMB]